MNSQEAKFLKDKKTNGKENDWRGKKQKSLKISKIYKNVMKKLKPQYKTRGVHNRMRKKNGKETSISAGLYDKLGKRVINYNSRAKNMEFCGGFLDFAKNDDDKLKLVNANFCRVALCPMCQWRKSLRVFYDTSKIVQEVENRYKNLKPIFLTLTVKNCILNNLKGVLDDMFKGWDLLLHSRTLKPKIKSETRNIIKGWFRALEVEYDGDETITLTRYNKSKEYYDRLGIKVGDKNLNYNTFHPHFHAILYVDKSYFTGEDYLKTTDWVQLWRKSTKLNYDPICDVRAVKNKGRKKGISEVAKYTYKDAEILKETLSEALKVDVIQNLSNALFQRRLYAYGGVMKAIAAELKLNDIENSDFINVDGEPMNASIVKMILGYKWNMGLSNYKLVQTLDWETGEIEFFE